MPNIRRPLLRSSYSIYTEQSASLSKRGKQEAIILSKKQKLVALDLSRFHTEIQIFRQGLQTPGQSIIPKIIPREREAKRHGLVLYTRKQIFPLTRHK